MTAPGLAKDGRAELKDTEGGGVWRNDFSILREEISMSGALEMNRAYVAQWRYPWRTARAIWTG